jgi:urease accessory protein UreF
MASAVALLVLAGCGTQRAGSAALTDDDRLSEGQVADQIAELSALYDENPEEERLSEAQLTQSTISWWLNTQVMDAFAAANDLTVTPAQIDQVLGPEQQRDLISLGAGIAPSQLESAARALVTYQVAAQALVAGGQSEQQAAAELAAGLEQTARDIGVRVSPRFGSGWIPGLEQQLAPRNPDRLSSPAEGSEPVPAEFDLQP